MDIQYDITKNIPETIKAINNTYEINQITYYENQLACMISSPIMFLGTITSLLLFIFYRKGDKVDIFIDMIIFLVLGIFFELLRLSKLKLSIASNLITILFVLIFLFTYFCLYEYIGPAVWTISAIQIILAMSRLRRDMAIVIGIITVITCIYTVLNAKAFEYQISLFYLIPQVFLLLVLLVILSISHRINRDRYENLYRKYLLVNEQKSDITALYEELIASEDELREQNNQLADYNQRFIAREQKLHSLAYYDVLTGLPNRTMFMEHLEQTIEVCTRKGSSFYLVLFDIDAFKTLNHTSGYQAGDQYLLFVSEHIREYRKEEDFLSRIDGDEFALLIRRTISEADALSMAIQMADTFSLPFQYNNTTLSLTASYGISVFPKAGTDASTLLRSAYHALYKTKRRLSSNL
jgi:diguanylate cyclase (GGDEF)-like protein